jgi:hypothetical protein
MSAAVPAWQALGLVFGLGLAWTSVHCAGMCGPLVTGLRLGRPAAGCEEGGRARRLARTTAQLGAYQAGRAAVYAGFGALAGWAGALVGTRLHDGELVVGVALASAFFITALARLGVFARLLPRQQGRGQPLAARLARAVPARQPLAAAALLGAALAFLPCGIVLWALGLAAASGDALRGALVMVALVAMTTPALAAVAMAPVAVPLPSRWRAALQRWGGRWLEPAALAFSGSWILVMAIGRSAAMACHQLAAG